MLTLYGLYVIIINDGVYVVDKKRRPITNVHGNIISTDSGAYEEGYGY